jgi:uncharacterized protein YecE (DUF72 family)
LFDNTDAPRRVLPAVVPAQVQSLAQALRERFQDRCRLGTSSWYFPGWAGQVWARPEAVSTLTRHGLQAYAVHPLLNTVSLDRAFYRPLGQAEYAQLAAQVPAGFRFVVKAPALLTDSVLRDAGTGAPRQANPSFLDAALAASLCAQPAAQGLGDKLGALVLQLSPLSTDWLLRTDALFEKIAAAAAAIRPHLPPTAQLVPDRSS